MSFIKIQILEREVGCFSVFLICAPIMKVANIFFLSIKYMHTSSSHTIIIIAREFSGELNLVVWRSA